MSFSVTLRPYQTQDVTLHSVCIIYNELFCYLDNADELLGHKAVP